MSAAHAGIEPIKRTGNARMKLSLAAYSFRDARLKIRRTTVPQYLQQLRKLLG
jgi:hypothetical protein